VARARVYEAEVNALLKPAQRVRLRQIALQAEGPGAFNEPEVVSELGLTAEQRDRIRTIEDELLFGWMRGAQPAGVGDRTVHERVLAVLTEDQVRHWKTMTGEALKSPITPFPPPGSP
jgi:hypothetical protein